MSPLFRRRRDQAGGQDGGREGGRAHGRDVTDLADDATGAADADTGGVHGTGGVDGSTRGGSGAAVAGPSGPYDMDASPPPARRLDLGALRIPVVDAMQIQLEVDRASRQARSATVIDGPSRLRLSVFAAPRTAGVWDDVRTEIVAEVTRVGGTAREQAGEFGTEVLTTIPTTLSDGRQALQVQRFVGVDGRRWFLRAVLSGPEVVRAAGITVADADVDDERVERLHAVLRNTVVVRGSQARPPREPLALTLPESTAVPAGSAGGTVAGDAAADLATGPVAAVPALPVQPSPDATPVAGDGPGIR